LRQRITVLHQHPAKSHHSGLLQILWDNKEKGLKKGGVPQEAFILRQKA
jgi:hypothetical protein